MALEKYIMQKVKEFAASSKGKALIKEKTGLIYDEKMNVKEFVKKAAQDMRDILYYHIHHDNQRYPGTPVVNTLKHEDIIVGAVGHDETGRKTINVGFDENSLHRESLWEEAFPEGIDNIILLHARGYDAKSVVYGLWMIHDEWWMNPWVASITHRDPNDFLQRAVAEFNEKYKGYAVAELQGEYKE